MKRLSVEDILQREHERRIATTLPVEIRRSPPSKKAKRGPKKKVTTEMVAEWSRLQNSGLSYPAIAARSGFHPSTVAREVAGWRRAQRERLAS